MVVLAAARRPRLIVSSLFLLPSENSQLISLGLFLVERKYGTAITVDEARILLSRFGKLDYTRSVSDVERAAFNLNDGVIASFQYYDDGQTAVGVSPRH